jgi:hypothetical protein
MQMKRILAVVGFALGLSAVGSPTYAQTVCTGDASGAFQSLLVPAGAVCRVSNATIEQGIVALEGSWLYLLGGVTVNGNVSASSPTLFESLAIHGVNTIHGNVAIVGGEYVTACGTQIGGNVLIAETANRGTFGFSLVLFGGTNGFACAPVGGGNTVSSGNVRIAYNDLTYMQVADNAVSGNVTIVGNTGAAAKYVFHNQLTQHLTCRDNVDPVVAEGNTAAKLVGQCAP